MKTRLPIIVVAILAGSATLAAAVYAGYRLGAQHAGHSMAVPAAAQATPPMDAGSMSIPEGEAATRRHIATGLKAGDVDPGTGQRILYYHDPMVPGKKFDRPAKSPFMDMMLVPVYGASGADTSSVSVSPRLQQNLGVRTALVVAGSLEPSLSVVGSVAYNERDQAVVQTRSTAFVERLHVRATLDRVSAGQPLAELYVPEWMAAQQEYLAVRAMRGPDLAPLVDAARARLRQTGMDEAQIARVESSGTPQARFTLHAPIAGIVTELAAREGMTLMAGALVARLNGLATVWANAEVPEPQAALLRPGMKVQATSAGLPGTTFEGRVQAVLPEVNPVTRTVKARVELANPRGALVPGLWLQMRFALPRSAQALLVPTEALIVTGTRTLVMLAEDDGRFRPVDVETGLESGGQTEVRRGLAAGQRIVVSSQFLLDSEASLKGVEARLGAPPGADAAPMAAMPAPAARPAAMPAHAASGARP
jgi:membrane fusion protein, copper/silver efflux system